MNWADFLIIGIVVLSAGISVLRGFVKEALSLAAWVAALWLAMAFAQPLSDMLDAWIETPSMRMAVTFLIIFIGVLLLGGMLGYLAGQVVKKTGLSGTDRMLGTVFGVLRGVVIVGILVLLAGFTPLPGDPWWSESQLLPHFERFALWLAGFLPPDIAGRIGF